MAGKCLRRLLALLLTITPIVCAAAELPDHVFVAYHDSWNEWPATTPQQTSLARLPSYIGVVLLAFARPDTMYRGGLDISHTGLEYQMTGRVLRDAIALLKHDHPRTRVLLSVGGAAYRRWDRADPAAVATLVSDFGLDGVDIDYEPSDPQCGANAEGVVNCSTDHVWDEIIAAFRGALPRPLLLTASAWSVGAYGERDYRDSRPRSPYSGIMLALLRTARASDLDLISINAYDAGPDFDPLEAFRAYRNAWAGRLALGVEVRLQGGAGPFHSAAKAEALAHQIANDRYGGMMLYPLLAMPNGAADQPTASDLALALCRGLGLAPCTGRIP